MNSIFLFVSKWMTLLLLFLLFLLANFLLGEFMPKEHALDLKFGYSVDEAYGSLNQLDKDGRGSYQFGILVLDMPYLLIYFLLFSGILMKIWKYKWVVFIPFAIMLLDFFENLTVLSMLNVFPYRSEILAVFASIFTTSKWVMIGILAVFIILGLILRLFKRSNSEYTSGEQKI